MGFYKMIEEIGVDVMNELWQTKGYKGAREVVGHVGDS